MSGATSFINRYWRIILFIIALMLFFWFIWSVLNVLVPFLLGIILAYLLLPVIRWVEKKLPGKKRLTKTKRILLIILFYLIVIAVIGLVLYYTVPLLISSISQFITNLPDLINNLNNTFQNLLASIRKNIPPQIQTQLDAYLSDVVSSIASAFQSSLGTGLSYVSATFGFVVGFASLPVFLFFLLKDAESLTNSFYSALSPWLKTHVEGVINIFSLVLGRYIRASIVLGLAVSILDFIGLIALGIPYAPALAFWAGLTELIPVLGPWIGAIPGVIVTLAVEPGKTIWIALIYWVVQLIEGNVLVPRIHSQYLNIHPTLILILLVLGGHFAGLWGIILIVPGTALFVQLFKFIIKSINEETLKTE